MCVLESIWSPQAPVEGLETLGEEGLVPALQSHLLSSSRDLRQKACRKVRGPSNAVCFVSTFSWVNMLFFMQSLRKFITKKKKNKPDILARDFLLLSQNNVSIKASDEGPASFSSGSYSEYEHAGVDRGRVAEQSIGFPITGTAQGL